MKKEYLQCITSLISLLIGIVLILYALLFDNLTSSVHNAVILLGICFTVIGLITFSVHLKRYFLIKDLLAGEIPLLARWSFTPSSSSLITNTLFEQRSNTFSTIILCLILGLIFSTTLAFSHIDYHSALALTLATISLLGTLIAFVLTHQHYKKLLSERAEIFFVDDFIYYLGQIFFLEKSIYLLEDIKINTEGETSLLFLYGQSEFEDSPVYTLQIPIPEGQLPIANMLRDHYLALISSND